MWLLGFLLAQYVAFCVVLALDPAGFDTCDPATADAPRHLQTAAAVCINVAVVAAAIWLLRRWYLLLSLIVVALVIPLWTVLLSSSTAGCAGG